MNKLKLFCNPVFGEIRSINIDDKNYFIATDIARALGYKNTSDAIARHCRWVVKHDIPHPQSKSKVLSVNIIPEGDVYRLISNSELPNSQEFESWVFDEVLPQIRKTGGYIPVDEKDTEFEILAKAVLIGQRTMEEQKRLIEEQNIKINDLLPKAQSYDQLINSKGLFSMGEVAQSIGLFGRTKFMKVLRNMGILQATTCRPYQPFVDKKYFMVKDCVLPNGENAVVTKVTPKGVDYIVKRFKKSGLLPSVNQEVII